MSTLDSGRRQFKAYMEARRESVISPGTGGDCGKQRKGWPGPAENHVSSKCGAESSKFFQNPLFLLLLKLSLETVGSADYCCLLLLKMIHLEEHEGGHTFSTLYVPWHFGVSCATSIPMDRRRGPPSPPSRRGGSFRDPRGGDPFEHDREEYDGGGSFRRRRSPSPTYDRYRGRGGSPHPPPKRGRRDEQGYSR